MAEHRVSSHLGLQVADYDTLIRKWIPAYDEMLDTVVAIVRTLRAPFVVDLGAGTGALGGAILDGVTDARVLLVDIDPNMLELAATRVAQFGERASSLRGSFADPLPSCDAVVASLALHHIPSRNDKRAVYRRVREALRHGGVFVIADATVDERGQAHDWIYDLWAAHMAPHGIVRSEADQLFANWAKHNSKEGANEDQASGHRPHTRWEIHGSSSVRNAVSATRHGA